MSDTFLNLSGNRVGGVESITTPLPHTQFLYLASRPPWSSFSLNPSVSTSVNVFKISGAKQRSSLNKKRKKVLARGKHFQEMHPKSGHEVLRGTLVLESQTEVRSYL